MDAFDCPLLWPRLSISGLWSISPGRLTLYRYLDEHRRCDNYCHDRHVFPANQYQSNSASTNIQQGVTHVESGSTVPANGIVVNSTGANDTVYVDAALDDPLTSFSCSGMTTAAVASGSARFRSLYQAECISRCAEHNPELDRKHPRDDLHGDFPHMSPRPASSS